MTSYPNPWDFYNHNEELSSGKHRIEYSDIREIAMGSPLTGSCHWIDENSTKTFLGNNFGGPAIWNEDGTLVAIPKWTKKFLKGTVQLLTILNIKEKEIIQYKKTFDLIQVTEFKNGELTAIDHRGNRPEKIVFKLNQEKIKLKRKL